MKLTDLQTEQLSELLNVLDMADLQSLAKTITNTLMIPDSKEEAVSTVLQYSVSVSSLLGRRKISKELVFKYLHKKKVACLDPNLSKARMVELMNRMWDRQATRREERAKASDKIIAVISKENASAPVPRVEITEETSRTVKQEHGQRCRQDLQLVEMKAEEDEQSESETESYQEGMRKPPAGDSTLQLLAETFTRWFYEMLNKGESVDGQKFGAEHFWPDSFLQIQVYGLNLNRVEKSLCGEDSANLLSQLRSHFDLCLNPNISAEGVLAQTDSHGLIKIVVCGTVHRKEMCVGFFEQSFLLIRDPSMQNNWRIKRSEIQMKTSINGETGRIEANSTTLLPILYHKSDVNN